MLEKGDRVEVGTDGAVRVFSGGVAVGEYVPTRTR